MPPAAPAHGAPADGDVLAEGASVALSWSGAGTGPLYLGEISGPAGTMAFGPQAGTSLTIGPLPAGERYTWRVRARNTGGDGPWSEARTFSVRLTAPSALQGEATSCTTATLNWVDASGYESGYRIVRDGVAIGDVGPNVTSATVANLGGGATHAFRVRAFRGTEVSAASDPISIVTPSCDVTPPDASWVEPAAGAAIRSASVRLEAAVGDSESGVARVEFQGRWDGTWRDIAALTVPPYRVDWNTCAAGVPDGAVTLRVRAFDGAGNLATVATDVTKRVDCGPFAPPAPPVFVAPGPDALVAGDVPIVVSATDSYDAGSDLLLEVRIDDGPWSGVPYDAQSGRYRTTWNSTSVADGAHTLRARATDGGGLTTISAPIQVTVDNVAEAPIADAGPDLTMTDGDGNGAEVVTLDARSSSHDPQRTATYSWQDRWDGREATSLGSGERLDATLGLGTHAIVLTVTDSRGLQASDEVVVTVNALPDTSPPSVSWTAPADGATITARTVRLGANAADAGGSGLREVRFRARWNGSWHDVARLENPPATATYDWDLCAAGVPDGAVDLEVTARDGAGNEPSVPATRRMSKRFACGTAAPDTLAVAPGSGAPGETIAVTVGGFTPGESVTLTWDNGSGTEDSQKQKKHKGKKKGKGKGKGKGKNRKGNRTRQAVIASVAVASATVSADGYATLTFTVPTEAAPGTHRITASGSTGSRAGAEFTVTPGQVRAAAAETAGTEGGIPASEPGPQPPAAPHPDAAVLPETSAQPAGAKAKARQDGPNRASPKRKAKKKRDHAVRPQRPKPRRASSPHRRRRRGLHANPG